MPSELLLFFLIISFLNESILRLREKTVLSENLFEYVINPPRFCDSIELVVLFSSAPKAAKKGLSSRTSLVESPEISESSKKTPKLH